MTSLPWYLNPKVWIDISWGFFLLGVVLVILAVMSGFGGDHDSDFDHDMDVDHDFDVSHDIDHDIDHDFDHDMDVDHDIDHDIDHAIDHDIDFDTDVGESGGFTEMQRGAPFSMLMGTFFLVYGGSGLTLFMISNNVMLNVAGMILIAFVAMLTVNTFFKTFFKTGTYKWRPEAIIGKRALVLFEVDANHGTVRVDTGTPLGTIKYPARPLDPSKRFKPGEYVYVVDYREGFAIVHDKPIRYKGGE